MMNRLRVPRASSASSFAAPSSGHVESASYSTIKTTTDQPVTIFAPVHYETNYAYPLVVWLHGPGENEHQLKRIMPLVSLRNYVGVAVRGTTTCSTASGRTGFAWAQSQPHTALAEQRVLDAINFIQGRFNVSSRRVFLAGFDCGGTMALRLALAHPRWFAGVLSLAGEFPVGGAPLSRLPEARRVPLFLACGRDSQRYPSAIVCDNLKLLHSAGMDLTLREYPGGHEISPQMLSDVDRWIMDIVTGASGSNGSSAGEG
ncbi:MAG TPA: alpha/beta hydrolase-fold protein [Pirellulales bacterium]|jgi:phospholipase/carboxylesterase